MLQHNYYGNFTAEEFEKLPTILQRFLSYTQYDTTSDASSPTAPSTEAQKAYAQLLKAEFESVGVKNVYVTEFGIVMGFIEATPGYEDCPAMGLIAHMDTSPEASGAPAQWSVIDYQGGDIVLNKEKDIVLQLSNFPEVGKYAGQKLVVTDGTTLLGADDKAGIALCVEAARYAIEHPEIPHRKHPAPVPQPDEYVLHDILADLSVADITAAKQYHIPVIPPVQCGKRPVIVPLHGTPQDHVIIFRENIHQSVPVILSKSIIAPRAKLSSEDMPLP